MPIRRHVAAASPAIHAGQLKIAVNEPPEKGKANNSIAEVLADILQVPPSRVSLVSGATSRSKKFLVAGAALDSIQNALARRFESAAQREER